MRLQYANSAETLGNKVANTPVRIRALIEGVKTAVLIVLAVTALTGCVAYPVAPGPYAYAPPPPPVVVVRPYPYYAYYGGYYGHYGYGWRGHRRWR